MVNDPICGMVINPRMAKYKTVYEGKPYYFCCPTCQELFESDSSKYLLEKESNTR